ncbi:uncharacterized protein BDV17DRAFT_286308 [Aspergillus undulatus]|uniref:uncharacterized protein n=1 Tax=Aspergillus undulatus TaxID=1810928 RepID=UPI003CCD554C
MAGSTCRPPKPNAAMEPGSQAEVCPFYLLTAKVLTNLFSNAQPLTERDKRMLKTYGKLPRAGKLGQPAQKRFYFDSGDSALSAAHKVTDSGAIQTGTAHPVRESISHPYVPVPHEADKRPIKEIYKSPLSKDWNEYEFSAGPEE